MKRVIYVLVAVGVGCLAGFSQEGKFEVQPFVGYKFGGGAPVDVGSSNLNINKINFNSSASYGVSAGYNFTDHVGAEFLWNRQSTEAVGKLAGGGEYAQRMSANLDQFHGNLILHVGEADGKVKPFVLMGLGATRGSGEGSSLTKFSFGLGGGVKYFFTEHMGVRLQARYAPTYLYSTAGGVWCNWWGVCWGFTNSKFLHQGDISAGWDFRF